MTCRKHGPLDYEQAYVNNGPNRRTVTCKACRSERNAILTLKNTGLKHVPKELIELKKASMLLKRAAIAERKEKLVESFRESRLNQLSKLMDIKGGK